MSGALDLERRAVMFDKGFLRAGARVTSVGMREPTVADQIAAERAGKSAAEQEIALIGNLCELTPDEVASLSMRDYRRLQEALVDFTS